MRVASSTFIKPTFSNQVKSVYSGGARKVFRQVPDTSDFLMLAHKLAHFSNPKLGCNTPEDSFATIQYGKKIMNLYQDESKVGEFRKLADFLLNDSTSKTSTAKDVKAIIDSLLI